ncbi:MAG: nucleotidyltransferase family protein [Ginsengibacter sp.]
MIKEAVILAGGLGTRLQSVVSDRPKCMALVNGKPFLHYLVEFLKKSGIQKFLFSVGYLHESIEEYLRSEYSNLQYKISVETEPLGTGGAVKLACQHASEKNLLVCNGDTLFKVDVVSLYELHLSRSSNCTLCLKLMQNFDRYGVVTLNEDDTVKSFHEKKFYESGLINGGVYAVNAVNFMKENLPDKFSFEKDYLENNTALQYGDTPKLYGIIQDKYFIDIGIPEDYERAGRELK